MPSWWDDPFGSKAIKKALDTLIKQGEKIMAQLDDLKASLQASNDMLATVAPKVDTVQAEVQALIDKINSMPTSPDLTEVQALAQGIQDKINALSSDLDTTPPAP